MGFEEIVTWVTRGVEAAGIVVIVVGAVVATVAFVATLVRSTGSSRAYQVYRQGLGRAILLGLEFLVAADIIRTVAISPTFESVGVLAAIVFIRTFLSIALELEIEGRWPWQGRTDLGAADLAPEDRGSA